MVALRVTPGHSIGQASRGANPSGGVGIDPQGAEPLRQFRRPLLRVLGAAFLVLGPALGVGGVAALGLGAFGFLLEQLARLVQQRFRRVGPLLLGVGPLALALLALLGRREHLAGGAIPGAQPG